MNLHVLETIFSALNERSVRYLVAGGVAVNAHGYQRLTHDLDLVLDLSDENVMKTLEVLRALGYRPILPVPPEDFADPEKRREWHLHRNLEVFSLVSDAARAPTVDIFVREPFSFDDEYTRAMVAEIAPGVSVPFVCAATLIAMKEAVGRPRDQDDVQHLRWVIEERRGEGTGG